MRNNKSNGAGSGHEGEKSLKRHEREAEACGHAARKAELYLLDEPLNGIDYKAREEIISLILEEADGENTFVISTHLLEEVESFIEYAIFIKDGHLADKVNLESERMKSGRSLTELYTDIL